MTHSQTEIRPPSPAGGAVELETEVIGNPGQPIRSAAKRPACLVQIHPADAGLGQRYLLDRPLTFGREDSCEVHLDETAVSRAHARVVERNGDSYVADLRSTNGTFVNDLRITVRKLADGDYLRIGNHIFRFLAGGNIEGDYHEEIYRRTVTDAMTGLYNKRFLIEFVDRELVRSVRHHRPLSLVLLDLDHFKQVNDTHGHLAGDAVLRALAARLQKEIRRDELFARYGGEEFAVVLPETEVAGAERLAERLRELVADQPFEYDGRSLAVTISLGLTTTDGDETLAAPQFIARADEKLYQAKKAGRNKIGY